MIILLDGNSLSPDLYEGEGGISITYTYKDSGDSTQKKAISGDLTFYGTAFALIYDRLIAPSDGGTQSVPCSILEDCGTAGDPPFVLLEGLINGDMIDWCEGDCFVKVRVEDISEDARRLDCLESTLISDDRNGLLTSQVHPRIAYCDEIRPEWLHHVILISGALLLLMFFLFSPFFYVFTVLVTAINGIIAAINVLPGISLSPIDYDGDEDTDNFAYWNTLTSSLSSVLIGCGRKHPSPKITSYLENVCSICDLTLESSIFSPGSDYAEAVILSAPVKKGTRDDSLPFIYENRLLETGKTFLELLRPVFNTAYAVEDGVLYLERKDELPSGAVWVASQALKDANRLVGKVCFKWKGSTQEALWEGQFMKDGLDETGAESFERYHEVVEWNQPYREAQKGKKEVIMSFGVPRFRGDGVEPDLLAGYSWLPFYSNAIQTAERTLLLSRGIASQPKLITWDGTDVMYARCRAWNVPGYLPTSENFNYPFHLTTFGVAPDTAYPSDAPGLALYGRFHAIDSPRVFTGRGWSYEMEFEYTYQDLVALGPRKTVQLSPGTGSIDEVRINPEARTIFVTGTL